MALLPIIARELRSRSRNRITYWSRFAVALVGTMICVSQPDPVAGMGGRQIFNAIVGGAFLFSCAACLVAADSIQSERRQGTLGLLFLTRARSMDVLLGKLSSAGFLAIWALVASIPVIMVPLMAGGITPEEALRTGLALLSTMIVALTAGLCVAAWQVQRAKVIRSTLALMLLILFLPLIISGLVKSMQPVGLLSPIAGLSFAGDAAYRATPGSYWGSLGLGLILTISLFLTAGAVLRRTAGLNDVRARPKPVPIAMIERVELTRWEPGKEDSSPVEWLAFRQQGVRAFFWVIAVFLLALSGWVPAMTSPARSGVGGSTWVQFWPFGFVGAMLGGAVVAWVSSRFLFGARNSRELEVLLTTPVCADRLIPDQWHVFKRLFLAPAVAMQLAVLIPTLTDGGNVSGFPDVGPVMVVLSLAVSGFTVTCLCWVAMWLALKLPSQVGVIGLTVVLVIACSWLIRFLVAVASAPFASGTANLLPYWLPDTCVLLFLIGLWIRTCGALNTELHGIQTSFLVGFKHGLLLTTRGLSWGRRSHHE